MAIAHSQEASSYSDGSRGEVSLPLGDLSFADAVVSHTVGSGQIRESASDPAMALGAPTFTGNVNDGSFLSLGCDGTLVLQFIDNALVDLPGPDLYVFEVGPKVEGVTLEISTDGQTWFYVGLLKGGRSDVDISAVAQPEITYRFVRLTDDGEDCDTRFAGADIDAVAAIGSSMRFVLEGEVLFKFDSIELRSEAKAFLEDLANEIAHVGITTIQVIGHTDSIGSDDYNKELSEARARAVSDSMVGLPALSAANFSAVGYGESEPLAPNDTEDGRRQNRRVEIIGGIGG